MEDFLDREPERNKVSEWLKTTSILPLSIIVAGRSGVGKSSFTRYISSEDTSRLYVRVSIPGNFGHSIQAGSYLRQIAIEIDSLIKEEAGFESFEERIRKKSRKAAIKDVANTALDVVVPEKWRKSIYVIHEKWTGTGASDWKKKLFGESPSELSDIRQYLTEILQELPMGVVIENAQNIDEYSLSWIQNVAAISERHNFLFEWTVKDSSDASGIRDLRDLFKPFCSISDVVWLEKLPLEYAIQVIPPDRNYARDWLQNSYGMWDGNLIPLVDLDVVIASETDQLADTSSIPEIEDNSAEKFKQLTFDQQVFTSIVILSGGQITKDTLFDCFSRSNSSFTVVDLTENIEQLTKAKLLSPSPGSSVSIRHDSIVSSLSRDLRFIKAQTIAASVAREHCENRIKEDLTLSEEQSLIFFQLRTQIFLDDVNGAVRSLEHICKLKAANHSPSALCDTLLDIVLLCKNLEMSLPSQVIEKLVLQIVTICIRSRIFAPTKNILELIDKPNIRTKLLEALVLLGTENTKEAHEICNSALNECEPKSHLYYCAQIVNYVTDRHLGKIDAGRTRWDDVNSDLKKNQSHLKGFVLRNSEMFLPPKESIKYLVQSVRLFSEYNNEIQFAYSLNSLAGQLMRIKRYRLAKAFFERSLNILKNFATDSLSVENNLAIVKVRLGIIDANTLKLFERAAIESNNNFSQLCVTNNLSSYYFLIDDEKQAKRSALAAIQLIQRNLISSPQVKSSIYESLKRTALHYNDSDLIKSIEDVEIDLELEPDVYSKNTLPKNKKTPSFIILTNWYPDPDIVLFPN